MELKRLSIFKSLRDSIQNVLDNFKPFVVALTKTFLFAMLAILIIGGTVFLIGGASMIFELKQIMALAKATFESKTALTPQNYQAIVLTGLQFVFGHLLSFIIAGIVSLLLVGLMSLAYTRFALNVNDKTSSQFSIFSSTNFKLLPTYFLAILLFWFLILIGGVLFFFPAVFFYLRFGLFNYFIVDQNAGVIESLKRSWRATAGYGWEMLALYIITFSLSNFGFLLTLITYSIGILMVANTYRQLTSVRPAQNTFA